MKLFPWQSSKQPAAASPLTELVRAGTQSGQIPANVMAAAKAELLAEHRAAREARQAAAEAKREKIYAVRAEKRAALLNHVASVMTPPELTRWSRLLERVKATGERTNAPSRDMRLDFALLLPPVILQRAGIEPDADNVSTARLDRGDYYRSRIAADALVHDDRPASREFVAECFDIINAGRKARGEPLLDRSQLHDPGDRRKPRDVSND